MKAYRFKVWYQYKYASHNLKAKNDEQALDIFADELNKKKVKFVYDKFRPPNKCFVTYEEVIPDVTTKVSTEKTSIGASMGQPSVEAERSNPWNAMDGYQG